MRKEHLERTLVIGDGSEADNTIHTKLGWMLAVSSRVRRGQRVLQTATNHPTELESGRPLYERP